MIRGPGTRRTAYSGYPFGTTNRLPLISIAAARTKATRLLYLRIDHARIYTSIRSALVLARTSFCAALSSPVLPSLTFWSSARCPAPARQLRKTGKKSTTGAPTPSLPPLLLPTLWLPSVFRRSIEQTSFAFFERLRRARLFGTVILL